MRKVMVLAGLFFLVSCKQEPSYLWRPSLAKYAAEAKQRGSREAAVPYAADEEEGENLYVNNFDSAVDAYEWILGEPIDERVFTYPESTILDTIYKIRVRRHWGRTQVVLRSIDFDRLMVWLLPPGKNEMLIVKSGGSFLLDGVLLKKQGSVCFSELMPRLYLLAVETEGRGKVGFLRLGCRGMFMVDGDQLRPRETKPDTVPDGMRDRYHNSLKEFARRFDGH